MPSGVRGATMAPIDVKKLLGEDSLEASFEHPVPFRFGYAFDVDLGLGNAGTWDTLLNGDRIWRLRLSSPHAYSINLIFSEFSMPQEGKLFIYNLDKTMVIGAFISNNNMPHGKFARQPVRGDAITLEYYEPASARGLGKLRVSKVIHAYRAQRMPIKPELNLFIWNRTILTRSTPLLRFPSVCRKPRM